MRLLIRADASPEIGAGHVMRCLALAQQCQRSGGSAVLVAASLSGGLSERLAEEGLEVERLASPLGSEADAEHTRHLVHNLEPDWVVLDGYRFNREYQRSVRSAGRPLLVIDDFAGRESYAADLVLDQNLGTEETLYRGKLTADRLLLGPRYALLRQEFLECHKLRIEQPARARRLLVLVGGVGKGSFLDMIRAAVQQLTEPRPEVRLQAGALLNDASEDRPEPAGAFRVIHRSESIAEQMLWAELAISFAGSTVWELCFLGCPTILLSVAANQVPAAQALDLAGVMTYLGPADSATAGSLARALEGHLDDASRRVRMSRRGRELVDGRGAVRVLDALRARI